MKPTKNKNTFIFLVTSLFLFFLYFSFVNAEQKEIGPFKQNQAAVLTQVCDNCTFVNLTQVQLPEYYGIVVINKAMTKNGQNYNYSFTQTDRLGDYIYTTCGNPDGTLTCESINFSVTPSGSKNVLGLFITMIVGIYAIAFIGFFGRNEWITLFGGLALILLGLFTMNNGVDIFRNTITDVFSLTTIGIGAFLSLFTGMSIVQDNM